MVRRAERRRDQRRVLSPTSRSSKPTVKVLRLGAAGVGAADTSAPESMPPDRNTPTGTSATRWARTLSLHRGAGMFAQFRRSARPEAFDE